MDLKEIARVTQRLAIDNPEGDYQSVARRDGITADQAYVLIMEWAWPLGIAIKYSREKAMADHPDWQAWRKWRQEQGPIPTLIEWNQSVERETKRRWGIRY